MLETSKKMQKIREVLICTKKTNVMWGQGETLAHEMAPFMVVERCHTEARVVKNTHNVSGGGATKAVTGITHAQEGGLVQVTHDEGETAALWSSAQQRLLSWHVGSTAVSAHAERPSAHASANPTHEALMTGAVLLVSDSGLLTETDRIILIFIAV